MYPVLTQLLCDNESLFEYERNPAAKLDFSDIHRRLIALERSKDTSKSDMFYEGMGEISLKNYSTLHELLWKLPEDLSYDYLKAIQGNVYIRLEKLDDWMNTITLFPPLWLIAGFFLKDFSLFKLHRINGIYEFVKQYLGNFRYTAQPIPHVPDLDYMIRNQGGLNDLHIHLNGSTETDVLWNFMLLNKQAVFRDFHSVYYNKKAKVRKLAEQVIADFTPEKLLERLEDARRLRNGLVEQIAINEGILNQWDRNFKNCDVRNLWGDYSLHSSLGPMIEELLFYLLVMATLREHQSPQIARDFHHYLLIKGMVHRFVVMQQSQVSFPQFQMLTDNSFRWRPETFYKNRFLQLGSANQAYLNLLEGRFSPKDTPKKNSKIVCQILDGFKKAKDKHPDFLGETSLALIAHFIKEPEGKKEKFIKIRHNRLRKTLIKKAIALNCFLTKSSYRNYVKGIDAAANEMDAGPEVFAPIYRYLRKKGVNHFTFHAGEDFRHLVSGLRMIYESVDFLELERGDRLGHCTALGLSPSLWMERCGKTFYISKGEWLDNLVFVWHLIRTSQNEKLQTLVLPLESEISALSYQIYQKSYPPYLLSKAWKLRKYNPFLYLEKEYALRSIIDIADNEEQEAKIRQCFEQEDIKDIMWNYHAPMEKHDVDDIHSTNSRKQYDEIISKDIRSLFSIEQLEILQTIILEYLSKKGIIIESLPTSNMRISYYKTWEEYHLEPWLNTSPDEGLKPAVVLGTDDPGIFMTNIYNEYACAYLHLEKKGHSPTSRIQKIKDIHTSSTIYKFDDDHR